MASVICHYRIFDLAKRPVASFVVYSDEHPNWRPGEFGYDLWGNRLRFAFPSVKLLDFLARWDELEQSTNPFAAVVMAHLLTQRTRGDNEHRFAWKRQLVRMLYERGFDRETVRRLYRIIDWMMQLPKPLDDACWREIKTIEEEKKMPYITTAERYGLEIGLQQGLEEGRAEGREGVLKGLRQILLLRFGAAPESLVARLGELNLPQLSLLLDEAFSAPTLEEFLAHLPTANQTN